MNWRWDEDGSEEVAVIGAVKVVTCELCRAGARLGGTGSCSEANWPSLGGNVGYFWSGGWESVWNLLELEKGVCLCV